VGVPQKKPTGFFGYVPRCLNAEPYGRWAAVCYAGTRPTYCFLVLTYVSDVEVRVEDGGTTTQVRLPGVRYTVRYMATV